MPRGEMLSDVEDMDWLREAHLRPLGLRAKSAVVEGNMDSPDRITLYAHTNPFMTDKPLAIITFY
jgi:hypothetical protein